MVDEGSGIGSTRPADTGTTAVSGPLTMERLARIQESLARAFDHLAKRVRNLEQQRDEE